MKVININNNSIEFSELKLAFNNLHFMEIQKEDGFFLIPTKENINIILSEENSSNEIFFQNNNVATIEIEIETDSVISGSGNNLMLNKYNLLFYDFKSSKAENNKLYLELENENARIEISNNLESKYVEAFSEPIVSSLSVNYILFNQKLPQYAVGVFDTEDLSRPRPIRNGLPVISTIPAPPNFKMPKPYSQEELDWIENGVGPESRKIHFMVTRMNHQIPDAPALLIAKPPDDENNIISELAIINTNETYDNNIIVSSSGETSNQYKGWRFTFEFNKEDGINSFDGLGQISPYLEQLTVERVYNIKFKVKPHGYPTG